MVALASPPAHFGDPAPSERDALLGALFLDELSRDRQPWSDDGLCHEYPGTNWFPTRGESAEPAKSVCRRCLVRDCAARALARPDIHGIWGATSAHAREQARAQGLDVDGLIRAVDTAQTAPVWETAPCRGCRGTLSHRDLDVADG